MHDMCLSDDLRTSTSQITLHMNELRKEIHQELLTWLKKKNQPNDAGGLTRRVLDFLDRPLVLMLIGGVFLTVATTQWQIEEQRRATALEYERTVANDKLLLLQEFAGIYENVGGIVNDRFARVVWLAQVASSSNPEKFENEVEDWRLEIRDLEKRFSQAPPLDAALIRIRILYDCASVRESATQMLVAWDTFVGEFVRLNNEWNLHHELAKERVAEAGKTRLRMLKSLEDGKRALISRMAGELSAARGKSKGCPA